MALQRLDTIIVNEVISRAPHRSFHKNLQGRRQEVAKSYLQRCSNHNFEEFSGDIWISYYKAIRTLVG